MCKSLTPFHLQLHGRLILACLSSTVFFFSEDLCNESFNSIIVNLYSVASCHGQAAPEMSFRCLGWAAIISSFLQFAVLTLSGPFHISPFSAAVQLFYILSTSSLLGFAHSHMLFHLTLMGLHTWFNTASLLYSHHACPLSCHCNFFESFSTTIFFQLKSNSRVPPCLYESLSL